MRIPPLIVYRLNSSTMAAERANSSLGGRRGPLGESTHFVVKWAHDSKSQLAMLTMHEIWLRPNYRAIAFAIIPPLVIAAAGALLDGVRAGESRRRIVAMVGHGRDRAKRSDDRRGSDAVPPPARGVREGPSVVLSAVRNRRLPCRSKWSRRFLGQGPSYLPTASRLETITPSILWHGCRSGAAAVEALGGEAGSMSHWCDGYVTIRGTVVRAA